MNLELKNCLPAKASGKGLLKPSLVCKDVSSHASRQPVLSVHLVAILSIIFPPLCASAGERSFGSQQNELARSGKKTDAPWLENGL